MNWCKPILAVGLVIGLASPLFFSAPALAQDMGEEAEVQGRKNVRSLKEIRGEGVVRQRLEKVVTDMDFVPREEFEAVKAMAAKARTENEKLEARIAALEARLSAREAGKT